MTTNTKLDGAGEDGESGAPRAGRYIPPLRFHALTRFYDRVLEVALKEDAFKQRLVTQASIRPGQRVLDLGCGTGRLTLMLKRAQPQASIIGLDADAEALAIARSRALLAGEEIDLRLGDASAPLFEPGSFDRVVSSLFFHHLSREEKRAALRSARALLRAGGELHVADWGKAQNLAMRAAFLGVQLLDGFGPTADNVRGRLPGLIQEAGFEAVAETHREKTIFGTLSLYRATVADFAA